MAFQLFYKPLAGKEKDFTDFVKDGYFKSHTRTDTQRSIEDISIHPLETIGTPCVGYSKEADAWAKQLFAQIKAGNCLLDYTVYSTIANSLPYFWDYGADSTIFLYLENKSEKDFLKYLKGFYVTDLLPKSAGIPVYSDAGKGEYADWLFDMFNFDWQIQNEIFKLNYFDSIREKLVKDLWTPADAIEVAGALISTIKNGPNKAHRIYPNLYSVKGLYGMLAPDELAHKVSSFANWIKFWAERGQYFVNGEKAIKLSTFKLKK